MPGWLVAMEGAITIALDVSLTEALRLEGVARELINRIQNLRKESGYEVTDRIEVRVEARKEIVESLASFLSYICAQTLANEIEAVPSLLCAKQVEWNDGTLGIELLKK